MPRWHPVIVFSPSINMDMSLACQIIVVPLSASKKQQVENVLGNVPFEHWDGNQV
jgi:hypothetical protein